MRRSKPYPTTLCLDLAVILGITQPRQLRLQCSLISENDLDRDSFLSSWDPKDVSLASLSAPSSPESASESPDPLEHFSNMSGIFRDSTTAETIDTTSLGWAGAGGAGTGLGGIRSAKFLTLF